jgi:tetratricopeptide (TPR) repeat protein
VTGDTRVGLGRTNVGEMRRQPTGETRVPNGAASTTTPIAVAPVQPAQPAISPADLDPASIRAGDQPTVAVELALRAKRLRDEDPVGAARAYVELGIYEERIAQDRARARVAFEAARALQPKLEPALIRARRLIEGRRALASELELLDVLVEVAGDDALRADLYTERARACEGLGRLAEARASYAHARSIAPMHAGALRGFEEVLRRELASSPLNDDERAQLSAELATHLERLADAYGPDKKGRDGDTRLSAWLHVERAQVLVGLNQPHVAEAALHRAVAIERAPGPVRDALRRHLTAYGRIEELASVLVVEAELERDDERAARLYYDAGRLCIDKLDAAMLGTDRLRSALERVPEGASGARRVMTELIRLLESQGEMDLAAEVRKRRLRLIADADAVAHEHVRLSEMFDALGQADQAAYHAERALEIAPEDVSTRERLDRALQRLGRHEDRVRQWIGEANGTRPVPVRVEALLRAADIANRHLRRREEAIVHLRAAWSIDPGNATIFDSLSSLLAPPPRDLEQDGRGIRARIDLYTQAALAADDPERRIGLIEKLVGIYEDELGQPARAVEEVEKILAIQPTRRSAILALQRNSDRANDAPRLAKALKAEADLTSDPKLRRSLLLRAAEVVRERTSDRDRAMQLVDLAMAIDPLDPDALRARHRVHEKAGRFDEARRTLQQLIGIESDDARRFALWIEIAQLDETRLKKPYDAVEAYGQAALVKPRHPIPPREITRLLRELGDPAKLVESLMGLAGAAADANEYAFLILQAAEVQELMLGDDEAAMKCLEQADALGAEVRRDPAVLEAMERIYVRRRARERGARHVELAALYARWLERKPSPTVDHGLRIALSDALAENDPLQATTLLEGLLGVVPQHVPALRMLEQIHRVSHARGHAPEQTVLELASALRREADVFTSSRARCGALWELAALEEAIGGASALDALARIVADAPGDMAAHEATIRIAGKLTTGVAVPHPAAIQTRARLVPALQARKVLASDPIARAMYEIEEAILSEVFAPDDVGAARAALAGYRDALGWYPESLLAARGLERSGQRLGDRAAIIQSQIALAQLVDVAGFRAQHLVRAASLVAEETARLGEALALYEEALRVDADCLPAAQAIATMLHGDVPRLVDRLGDALERASFVEQIVLLGNAIGAAVLRHFEQGNAAPDPSVGIAATRRVLTVAPDDVPSLLLVARLYTAQRMWSEARDTLGRVVEVARDHEARFSAHFLRCDLFEGPLGDVPSAQREIEAVLAVDPVHRRGLERLYQVAQKRGDRSLAIQALARLVEVASDPQGRVDADHRLAEACREAGDHSGRVRALSDAVATLPADARALQTLARMQRVDTPDGAASYAKSLQQVIDIATARRLPLDHRWLTTLGLLEVTILVRAREGLAHLQQATTLPNSPPETRVALGRGLEAAGRNSEAVQVLRDTFTPEAETFARLGGELAAGLSALESALAKEGRVDERVTVEEVRACLGEVTSERVTRLRARRATEGAPYAASLAGPEIARDLLPDARSPLIDVGLAMSPVAAKVLRFETSSLGVASRDRLSPRDGHPTRVLADRLARALGVQEFEIYLAATWQGAARVYPGDPPVIVAPASFADLPDNEQAYGLGRLLTRIALGLAYLDELAVEALDGLFLASLRQIEPGFGAGEITSARESMAQSFLAPVKSAIGRRQKKALEEIYAAVLSGYDARAFAIGVRRSEYRIGYLLSGDLVSSIDYLRRFDREVGRASEDPRILLQHPVTNELLRYALGAEAFAERRRIGTIWPG